MLLKTRKAGDPHPSMDPGTCYARAKRAQENAQKTLARRKPRRAGSTQAAEFI
jgi:hypothetical protein